MEQDTEKTIVSLNKSVKLLFGDGDEVVIKIVEQKPKSYQPKQPEELLIDSRTPLAQAILGHGPGEEIEYQVEENRQRVVILGIQ